MVTDLRPFELTIACPTCKTFEQIGFPATDASAVAAVLEAARLVEPILHDGHHVEVRWRWREANSVEALRDPTVHLRKLA